MFPAASRALPTDVVKAVVNSFVISRIDCCNSLLAGIPRYELDRLQSVLNTAARLLDYWSAPRNTIILNTWCWTVFTGFRFHNASSSSCACWRSRRCTDSHGRISPICANQSRQSEADRGCVLPPVATSSLAQHPPTMYFGAWSFAVAGSTAWN